MGESKRRRAEIDGWDEIKTLDGVILVGPVMSCGEGDYGQPLAGFLVRRKGARGGADRIVAAASKAGAMRDIVIAEIKTPGFRLTEWLATIRLVEARP